MGHVETVQVRLVLLFGGQVEVAAADEYAEIPEQYPAQEIADALGVSTGDLPGMRLLADVGAGDRLENWRLPAG